MSHFAVLVVLGEEYDPTDLTEAYERIETMLEPYSENESVEPYRADDSQLDILRSLRYTHATEKYPIDFPDPVYDGLAQADRDKVYAEYITREQEWAQTVLDAEGLDGVLRYLSEDGEDYEIADGRIYRMTTYNPDSQWDWWAIGGRWSGFFTAKTDAPSGQSGDHGVFGGSYEDRQCDVIRVKDIDWAAMDSVARAERETAVQRFRAELVKISPEDLTDERIRQSAYWTLGDDVDPTSDGWEERYLSGPFNHSTYAYLTKAGVWEGRSEKVGWWANPIGKEVNDWPTLWRRAIDALPPKTTVAVVDCHI